MANFLLINYEYPPIGGGAASATSNLASTLRGQGHQVVVLTSAFHKLRGVSCEDEIEIIRVPVGRKEPHRASLLQMARFVTAGSWMVRDIARRYSIGRVIAFFFSPERHRRLVVESSNQDSICGFTPRWRRSGH